MKIFAPPACAAARHRRHRDAIAELQRPQLIGFKKIQWLRLENLVLDGSLYSKCAIA
jgi:hypothetical protein